MQSSIPRKKGQADNRSATANRMAMANGDENRRRPASTTQTQRTMNAPSDVPSMTANLDGNVFLQQVPNTWNPNQANFLLHQGSYNNQDLTVARTGGTNVVPAYLPYPSQQRATPGQLDRMMPRTQRIDVAYMPPPPRQGHTFGDIIAEGDSKVIRGNVNEEGNIEALAWARDHKFGTLTIKGRAQAINGDTDTRTAGAFFTGFKT